MPDIALLYSVRDGQIAAAIAQRISQDKATVWPKTTRTAGFKFERPGVARRITRAAKVVVLLWSRAAEQDHDIVKLTKIAAERETLIVCLLDETPANDTATSLSLSQFEQFDLKDWNRQSNHYGFEALLRHIGRKLQSPYLGENDWRPDPRANSASRSINSFVGIRNNPAALVVVTLAVLFTVLTISAMASRWPGWQQGDPASTIATTETPTALAGESPVQEDHEIRLALVIHQSNYASLSELPGTKDEAKQIVDALAKIGFAGNVTEASNLTASELKRQLSQFRAMLQERGETAVGFVYFTGHGVQDSRQTDSFLLGIDAELRSDQDLEDFGISVHGLVDEFGQANSKAVFLVLDACRNVPSVGDFKSAVKGLGRVDPRPSILISYSTGAGQLAQTGVYASVLAQELVKSKRHAEDAFNAAKYAVLESTLKAQEPYVESDLRNRVCFESCP